jgi:hypothetical protein
MLQMADRTRCAIAVVIAASLLPRLVLGQTSKSSAPEQEQSAFGYDDPAPIQRPVKLSRAALDALSKDKRVASCLKANNLNPQELPANWFVASEIHLDGADEKDLVVLPGDPLPEPHPGEVSQNVCLIGANTAQMWVLRDVQNNFQLVLNQIALALEVLQSRTNGLRDIQVSAVVGMAYDDSIVYKFDGQTYKIAVRNSLMTGVEPPHSLSGYETREIVQLPSEPAEPIRAQARAWLWEQWKTHRLSYLKLKTHDSAGVEATSYYITRDNDGKWEVVIQSRRVLQPTASEGSITEDDLFAADEVQRIEPTGDDLQPPRVIPDSENAPGSKYKLEFLDYAQRTAATL